ncbi:MAG: FAD-dependent oxidoreductase [Pseudomonadota bacterium]
MKDLLFQPIRINRIEVKNRICLPAMHLNLCRNFEVTDPLIEFYAERARGGAGIITVGFATVDENSGNATNIGAHRDEFIPGLSRLARGIQAGGALAAVQINHAGRYNRSANLDGRQSVAPSAVSSRMTGETPRELSGEEIEQIIDRFAAAADRVKIAGYDAVEVLCGTGYLISEFLSPLTNRRTDAYGGALTNRMRFGLEVIAAIRSKVGENYPIIARMNGNDFMLGGNGRKDLQEFAKSLSLSGVDALNINVGWHEAQVPQIVSSVPRGVFAYLARGIKELVDVPVMAGHRINDPKTAREMIADGMCDMVAMGRSLIADPYLPEKARTGRGKEILHCTGCAQGCFDHLMEGKVIECLCNPRVCREKKTNARKVDTPKKVIVVGGGPGGISAALAASEVGHKVILIEKEDRLGGQLHLAGAPPGRQEFIVLARDLENQLVASPVEVMLNRKGDAAWIEKEKPDAVILATGALPIRPPIPGVELPHVCQAWEVLRNRVITGKRVVIVGGGAVGVETAMFMAEKGTMSAEAVKFLLVNRAEEPEDLYEFAVHGTKIVTLIEMIERIGKDIGRTTRWGMLQELERMGVKSKTATKALEITPDGIHVEKGSVVEEIPADTVVLAIGARPNNPLEDILKQRGIPCRVIGDANRIGRAFEAIHEGFDAGRNI